MEKLINLTDKEVYTHVYHLVLEAAEFFSRLSPNIPKALIRVTQSIHGDLNAIAIELGEASKKVSAEEKLKHLDIAIDGLFNLHAEFEYLVRTKALTVKGANEVLIRIKQAYEESKKWKNSIHRSVISSIER